MAYNTSAIRNLVTVAFSDEELKTLCFDHFRTVFEKFTAGMTKGRMVQLLLEHCERRGEMARLLNLVQQANPVQYATYADRIGAPDGPTVAEPCDKRRGRPTDTTVVREVLEWRIRILGLIDVWRRLKTKYQVAIVVALIGLVGSVFSGSVSEIIKAWLARPTATPVIARQPSPTVTAIASPTPILVDVPTSIPPQTPTASPTATHTATPTPSVGVVIEIDKEVSDDRCQEVDCGSFLRIEVKVLNSAGVQIQSAVFSYNWSFNPSDPHNEDKLDSKNYVINYYVPCELDNQTITIEVLKDGETLGVRSIRFNIKEQP